MNKQRSSEMTAAFGLMRENDSSGTPEKGQRGRNIVIIVDNSQTVDKQSMNSHIKRQEEW